MSKSEIHHHPIFHVGQPVSIQAETAWPTKYGYMMQMHDQQLPSSEALLTRTPEQLWLSSLTRQQKPAGDSIITAISPRRLQKEFTNYTPPTSILFHCPCIVFPELVAVPSPLLQREHTQ